jgi:hypothetical protein
MILAANQMASAPQPSHSAQQALTFLSTVVDIFSKGAATVAVVLYASGFLIISLHQSEYGFSEINPLRPKILAAGAWFLLFLAIPAATVVRARAKGALRGMDFARWLFPYYFGCMSAGFFASFLFNYSLFPSGAAPKWWVWVVAIIASLALVTALNIWDRFPRRIAATVSVLLTLFFAAETVQGLFVARQFTQGAIGFWFFGVGVVTLIELNMPAKNVDWTRTAFTACGALLVFAHYYYPHMKSSWGGGTPVAVTVYFAKDSPIKPNQSVPLQLIEESDAGFYIVGPRDSKAVFVPRNAISMIYFSDRVSDSIILK